MKTYVNKSYIWRQQLTIYHWSLSMGSLKLVENSLYFFSFWCINHSTWKDRKMIVWLANIKDWWVWMVCHNRYCCETNIAGFYKRLVGKMLVSRTRTFLVPDFLSPAKRKKNAGIRRKVEKNPTMINIISMKSG